MNDERLPTSIDVKRGQHVKLEPVEVGDRVTFTGRVVMVLRVDGNGHPRQSIDLDNLLIVDDD